MLKRDTKSKSVSLSKFFVPGQGFECGVCRRQEFRAGTKAQVERLLKDEGWKIRKAQDTTGELLLCPDHARALEGPGAPVIRPEQWKALGHTYKDIETKEGRRLYLGRFSREVEGKSEETKIF